MLKGFEFRVPGFLIALALMAAGAAAVIILGRGTVGGLGSDLGALGLIVGVLVLYCRRARDRRHVPK